MRELAQKANDTQVGGDHYKVGGEEHWDRVARLSQDYFQGQITKYVERWKYKGGVEDLKKARHFLDKYIEVAQAGMVAAGRVQPSKEFNSAAEDAALYGPRSGQGMPDVKRSGFQNFTYEGGTAEWDLYTCKTCRQEVRVPANGDPGTHSCPRADITGGVAG